MTDKMMASGQWPGETDSAFAQRISEMIGDALGRIDAALGAHGFGDRVRHRVYVAAGIAEALGLELESLKRACEVITQTAHALREHKLAHALPQAVAKASSEGLPFENTYDVLTHALLGATQARAVVVAVYRGNEGTGMQVALARALTTSEKPELFDALGQLMHRCGDELLRERAELQEGKL